VLTVGRCLPAPWAPKLPEEDAVAERRTLTISQEIQRRPADAFRFLAERHVENHPRWDPNMSLVQVGSGPIGVGTVIRRSYMRGETRVEGEMEVTEFAPDHAFAVIIRDGPTELFSRLTLEPEGDDGTQLTLTLEADFPVDRMDPEPIRASLARMKELLEGEV
jgi:hypothetical protein